MGHRRERRLRRHRSSSKSFPFDKKYEPKPSPLDRPPTNSENQQRRDDNIEAEVGEDSRQHVSGHSRTSSLANTISRETTLDCHSPRSITFSDEPRDIKSSGHELRKSIPTSVPENRVPDFSEELNTERHDDTRSMTLVDTQSEFGLSKADPGTTLYHIYHSGRRGENFVLHTIKDNDIPLCQIDDPTLPNFVEHDVYKDFRPSKFGTFWRHVFCMGPKEIVYPRYVKRNLVVDDPKLDCRIDSTPYYMHNPHLAWHLPPRTLRRGWKKDGPVICLMRPTKFAWRHWDLSFDERLTNGEILDGRGVIPEERGRHNGEGMYKGYRFRNFRWCRESGAAWHKEEKERRAELEKRDEQSLSKPPTKHKDPFTPEETIKLHWSSPWTWNTRRYHFRFCDVDFYWKGTATVSDKKKLGFFSGFNHLKLVASVPVELTPGSLKGPLIKKKGQQRREVCLAKYTSLISLRKAGRLQVFDQAVDTLFNEVIAPSLEDGDEKLVEKKRQQLHDLTVATALCMVIQEDQKREVLQEIAEIVLDVVQNAS